MEGAAGRDGGFGVSVLCTVADTALGTNASAALGPFVDAAVRALTALPKLCAASSLGRRSATSGLAVNGLSVTGWHDQLVDLSGDDREQ